MFKNDGIKISAVLCTFNEDCYLEECLKSISWADEIVLCDMGSTDRTLEIAKKQKCQIYSIERVPYVELARKRAIEFCSHEWVCFIDPDWIFIGDVRKYVQKQIKLNNDVTCFAFPFVNHYYEKPVWHGRWRPFKYPCLFSRNAMELLSTLHNGFKLKYGRTDFPPKSIYIKHMWISNEKHFYDKHKRYIKNEGLRRLSFGYKPSIVRKIKIFLSCLYRYVLEGGFCDGKIGYDLFKKSLWYEMESEKKLYEAFIEKTEKIARSCPVCQSNISKTKYNLYDDRYGFPGNFFLFECRKCGHKYLKVEFAPEEITSLYTSYYPRSTFKLEDYQPHKESKGFNAWFNGEHRSAFHWIPKNVKVLDIGCGFGETLGYYKARGCEVYGVETDENIKQVAEQYGFNIHIGLFDAKIYEPSYFDYITMDQVIEHIPDPIETLQGIARILKPGGLAILSTPNSNGWGARIFGRKWINWHAPYHRNFFSKKSMDIVSQEAGLTLERAKTVTSSEWLKYQWIHLLLPSCMGRPSVFWSPPAKRILNTKIRKLAFYTAIIFSNILHVTKVNHIITRLFDMLGLGDNYLYFLKKQ